MDPPPRQLTKGLKAPGLSLNRAPGPWAGGWEVPGGAVNAHQCPQLVFPHEEEGVMVPMDTAASLCGMCDSTESFLPGIRLVMEKDEI